MRPRENVDRLIDWLTPDEFKNDINIRKRVRMFLISHLFGPVISHPITIYLMMLDANPMPQVAILAASISAFWLFPIALKLFPRHYTMLAMISVANLNFALLWGSYNYGGTSSPFLIWVLSVPLLGFFYLGSGLVARVVIFAEMLVGISLFYGAYIYFGAFPEHIPIEQMVTVGMISALSATVYVYLMASYYASVVDSQSELLKEIERHRDTMYELTIAKDEAESAKDDAERAKDDAERANGAKSEFLAKMSHELRTPLNAVIGYSQILIEDAEDEGDTSNVGDLKKIHEAGEHLLELINRILDLSKIEAGKMELNLGEVHVARAMRELIHEHRAVARANNNQVSLQVADDIESVIWDAARVGDIFGQVYDNAHKFTKDGEVSVTVRRDRGACDRIAIDIRDTGIGIAPEHLNQLFETFSVVDDSSSSKYGGTGLGLALALRMTELMGGTISVESELGSGTCFSIVLPVTVVASIDRADGDAATTLAPALPEGAGHRGEAEPVLI